MTASKILESSAKPIAGLQIGQRLHGRQWTYEINKLLEGDKSHDSLVYLAKVSPQAAGQHYPEWAVLKTASREISSALRSLRSERDVYDVPGVKQCSAYRRLYEVLGEEDGFSTDSNARVPILAMEYLPVLWSEVSFAKFKNHKPLIHSLVQALMESFVALEEAKLVNTDIKPANIGVYDVASDHPIVKVADLGTVYPEGHEDLLQPWAFRAPEMFHKHICQRSCQIWAAGAILMDWMRPGILGLRYNRWLLWDEGWCLAKMMKLFPGWTPPNSDNDERQAERNLGIALVAEGVPEFPDILPLDQELQKAGMLPEVGGLVRLILNVNPEKRPSARQILESPELAALRV